MPGKKKITQPKDAAHSDTPNRMTGVSMEVAILLGRKRVPIETLLNWTEGSLIELKRKPAGAVDVQINGQPFAQGEVVTIGENFGVRLTEVLNRDVG
jgi:flagellar motor switch protein FliN/FliY